MKTLFITYFYPPGNTPAARRTKHLGQLLATNGLVYVITATGTAVKLSHVAETHVIPTTDLRSVMQPNKKATKVVGNKEKSLLNHLLPLRQAYPFLYLTDDGGPVYRHRAQKKASELIEKHGITTVFSSFRPWSDHLVARELKKKLPHLHWIADFRDLPVDPVRKDIWWPALQTWWGKRVIKSADEVWGVSEGQREQLKEWHPTVKVKRNALLALPPAQTAPVTDRFTIAYTGSLYSDLQSVDTLVDSLEDLLAAGMINANNLGLIYRGNDAELFRRWTARLPEECLDIKPSVAPAAAQKIQLDAQVLLMLNWSAPNYYGVLTAKLWDYLAAGRPILALVKGPGDHELEEIIGGANAGAVFADEEQGKLTAWIAEQYGTWQKAGLLVHRSDLERLKEYL